MKKYTEDLRAKSDQELKDMLAEIKESLLKMRFKNAFGQLESTAEIRSARRQTARILTILRERGVKL